MVIEEDFETKKGKDLRNFERDQTKEKAKTTAFSRHMNLLRPEKCYVESTKISIGPFLNEKLC